MEGVQAEGGLARAQGCKSARSLRCGDRGGAPALLATHHTCQKAPCPCFLGCMLKVSGILLNLSASDEGGGGQGGGELQGGGRHTRATRAAGRPRSAAVGPLWSRGREGGGAAAPAMLRLRRAGRPGGGELRALATHADPAAPAAAAAGIAPRPHGAAEETAPGPPCAAYQAGKRTSAPARAQRQVGGGVKRKYSAVFFTCRVVRCVALDALATPAPARPPGRQRRLWPWALVCVLPQGAEARCP